MKLVNFNTLKIHEAEGQPNVYSESLIWNKDCSIGGFAAQVRTKIAAILPKPVIFELDEGVFDFTAQIEVQDEDEINDVMECITHVVLTVVFQYVTLLDSRDREHRLNIPEDWKSDVFAPISLLKRAVNNLTILNALNIIIHFTYQGIDIGHYNLVNQMEK